jgi:hypothetical protein
MIHCYIGIFNQGPASPPSSGYVLIRTSYKIHECRLQRPLKHGHYLSAILDMYPGSQMRQENGKFISPDACHGVDFTNTRSYPAVTSLIVHHLPWPERVVDTQNGRGLAPCQLFLKPVSPVQRKTQMVMNSALFAKPVNISWCA